MQTCIYGIGLLAVKMAPGSFPTEKVLSIIDWIHSQDFKTESGKVAECTENSHSTLGKIVYF